MTSEAVPSFLTGAVPYGTDRPPRRTRLLLPVALLACFWIGRGIVASLDLTTFVRFIEGLVLEGLLFLIFIGWWIFGRGRGWAEKVGVFTVAVIGGVVGAVLATGAVHWFSFILIALPRVITAWVVWLVVARAFSARARIIGLMAIILLMWGYHDLLRMEGLWAEQAVQLGWRWSPTSEQAFLAGRANAPATLTAAGKAGPMEPEPGDWPGYLGADRSGVIRGSAIRTDWASNPPRAIWRSRAGPGWSSMIFVAGRLYTQEQRGEDDAVVCMDGSSGNELWTHVDRVRFEEPLSGAGPRTTPAFADGRLYALSAKGLLNCLDAATGQKIWSRDMPADAGGALLPTWAFCSSPLVLHDRVVVFAGGGSAGKGLLAYDAKTGTIAWTSPVSGSSYCSPMVVSLLGIEQVLMLTDTGLSAVDPLYGKPLWSFAAAAPGSPRAMNPQAIGDDSVLFASETDVGVMRLKVARDSNGTWSASKVWSSKRLNSGYNQFVIQNDAVYGFDGSALVCLDLATGSRSWRGERYGRGQVILLADQKLLLVMSETGEAVLLPAQPDAAPQELGRFQAISGKTWNQPILVHDRLYARNAQEIAAYELHAGPPK